MGIFDRLLGWRHHRTASQRRVKAQRAAPLQETLFAFLTADTWAESQRIVEQHPELLSDEADALLSQIMNAAQAQGDEDAYHVFEQCRILLHRCRQASVEQAFAEAVGAQSGVPPISLEFQADLGLAKEGEIRYLQTGDPTALEVAVTAWERILNHPAFAKADERFRLAAWNDAGGVYLRRYWQRGRIADLDQSLHLWEQAVKATPLDSPHLPAMLNNLGAGLRTRYARTGRLEDLQMAILAYEQAVEATPLDSPNLPSHLTSLGDGLRDRYIRMRRLEDLAAAIRVSEQAVEATPPDSPDLPMYLNNLGTGLSTRYTRTRQLEDLQTAIQVYEQAVGATLSNSPHLPVILNNLGAGLRARYARTGQLEDLQKAIRVCEQAVKATSSDSPGLPGYLNNLGAGLRARYARTGRPADLAAARESYRRACELGREKAPEESLQAGRNWGNWATARRAWAEAVEAYGYAQETIGRLFGVQYRRWEKTAWLREAQSVPARLAYAHAQLGAPEKAVEALEEGRARLLREALEQDRRDLERLPALGFARQYKQYQGARQHYRDLLALGNMPQRPADWSQQMRAAWEEVQAAVEAIRREVGAVHPEYAHFMQPPTFEQIARAAGDAPLVYLLATPAGGLALIVPGQTSEVMRTSGSPETSEVSVSAVWLDELTEEALNERLVKTDKTGENVTGGYLPAQLAVAGWMSDALADLLPWLGETVMGPVAQALHDQTLGVSETPKVSPVTLIPAGRLALLPLHAARYRRDEREIHFLDEFAVAYAPSALTLRTARRRLADRPPAARRLVGVGNPLPPVEALGDLHRALREAVAALPDEEATAPLRSELARLVARPTGELRHEGFLLRQLVLRLPERLAGAGAHGRASLQELVQRWPLSLRYAKAELQSVVDLLPPGAADPLYEQEATRAALLPRLAGADLLHFSCHGSFDPEEPLDSALHLVGDERLSLREMLDPDFPGLAAVRLATLSACQTAIGDYRNLPEEAIGLPAGLLQAGAPAVIGTLWSVDDASTALLMTRAYERMLQEGEPPLFALRRAQTWLRDLTNAELEAYLAHHEAIAEARRQGAQRMPFALLEELLIQVITAQDPAARPYADPYFWAPFAFYGVEEMPV